MRYFIRPTLNSERADDIVGPFSLDHINWMLASGKAEEDWLFVGAAADATDADARSVPQSIWQPLTALPEASCYRPISSPSQTTSSKGELDGCAKFFLMSVITLVALAAVGLAVLYAACGNMRFH